MDALAERRLMTDRNEALAYLCHTMIHGDRDSGCWEWPYYRLPTGYGRVGWGGNTVHVTRVAFQIQHGYWPEVCRHSCDNPPCFNPAHLLDGTQADNIRDKVERGRQQRGERVPQARLTEAQVHDIRDLLAVGERNQDAIAELYGVSKATISRIKHKTCWAWLPERQPLSDPNNNDKAES